MSWKKGEGKPLVFIPGLTFSGEIFKNQLEYFSSEYRVIAIDPRGQGYSAKTVDGNDYLTHGRDVAGLIDALGLKDIVLIGWSTGNLDTWSYVQQFCRLGSQFSYRSVSPLPFCSNTDFLLFCTLEVHALFIRQIRGNNCSISILTEKINAIFPLYHSIFFQPFPIFSSNVHITTAENGTIMITFSIHSVVICLSLFTVSQMPQPPMTSDKGFIHRFRFSSVLNKIIDVTKASKNNFRKNTLSLNF